MEKDIETSISKKFEEFDQLIELSRNQKEVIEEDLSSNYLTFLERWKKWSKLPSWLFASVVALLSFFIHLSACWIQINSMFTYRIFEDFSFFISILIGSATYIALLAMDKLRDFIINLIQISAEEDKEKDLRHYKDILEDKFIHYRLIPWGILFGAINVGLSLGFGISYTFGNNPEYILTASIILQYFIAGFVCGICVGGVMVVIRLINQLNFKKEIKLDYFYPDRCAGTLIVGKILFYFALYTIIIGLLIFVYIHTTFWYYEDNVIVSYLILAWKVFPFVIAAILFFYPVFSINKHLRNYKYFEQLRVRKRLSYLNELVLTLDPEIKQHQEELEQINRHYEKLERVDKFINQMNTWPYNLTYSTAFISVFLPAIVGIIAELSLQFFSKIIQW